MGRKVGSRSDRQPAPTGPERRRHVRVALGLPVGVHLAGRPSPLTVELLDISVTGGRFRCLGDKVNLAESATVVFVSQDQRRCYAVGKVVRADASGEFALRIEKRNDAFAAFVSQLTD
ncbi:MAG TPA: PilZ domain-containing protein [Polyangia bacterium]|nr:PilZ domain-containing protein [Polyangia bacterium]